MKTGACCRGYCFSAIVYHVQYGLWVVALTFEVSDEYMDSIFGVEE
jgi:hypothetical protein